MKPIASPRLLAYALIAGLGLLVGVAFDSGYALMVAGPFVVAIIAGLLSTPGAAPTISVTLDHQTLVEGEELTLSVRVAGVRPGTRVVFEPEIPSGFTWTDGPRCTRVPRDETVVIGGTLRAGRWGAHRLGGGSLVLQPGAGLFSYEYQLPSSQSLRVYPTAERLQAIVGPRRLQARIGTFVSRASGSGFEYAEVREFVPGDERRHVNWKVSARRPDLHVTRFHPERSADLVIFLDSFDDLARPGGSTLDWAVRGTASLALYALRRRERVGLLSLGGSLRWVVPGSGVRQLYRIVEAVLETESSYSYRWPRIESIPRRAMPAGALVLALTPLLDRRSEATLVDLRDRGHDVAIIEVVPTGFVAGRNPREELALRLWRLHRDVLRASLMRRGIAVGRWRPPEAIGPAITEVERFRRGSHRAHA